MVMLSAALTWFLIVSVRKTATIESPVPLVYSLDSSSFIDQSVTSEVIINPMTKFETPK